MGPDAVAGYLRLREAAIQGTSIKRPPHLETLLREGVVAIHRGRLLVPERAPELTVERLRSMTAGRLILGD